MKQNVLSREERPNADFLRLYIVPFSELVNIISEDESLRMVNLLGEAM